MSLFNALNGFKFISNLNLGITKDTRIEVLKRGY